MASKRKHNTRKKNHKERRIVVRGVRRDPPDIRKLSKILIALAMAEAEREAQAAHPDRATPPAATSPGTPEGGESHA
jgi:hypothetical protein